MGRYFDQCKNRRRKKESCKVVAIAGTPSNVFRDTRGPSVCMRFRSQADARRIELVAERNYPFGTKLKHEIKGRLPPPIKLSLRQTSARAQGRC